MTSFERALRDYVDAVTLGPCPRTEVLRERLRDIQRRNARYFVIPVVMLGASFLVAMKLILYSAGGTAPTVGIASLFGVSVVGMIRLMLSFWREKVATELLIELSEIDEAALRKLVARLLARMK
jgi:hypothetical protein